MDSFLFTGVLQERLYFWGWWKRYVQKRHAVLANDFCVESEGWELSYNCLSPHSYVSHTSDCCFVSCRGEALSIKGGGTMICGHQFLHEVPTFLQRAKFGSQGNTVGLEGRNPTN